MINPLDGLRVNPWADLPVRPRPERKPKRKPKAPPVIMAARARRTRRTKQQAKAEANQAATA